MHTSQQAAELVSNPKIRAQTPLGGRGHCLDHHAYDACCLVVALEVGIHPSPQICLDVETDDGTHAPRKHEKKIHFSYIGAFWREQVMHPSHFEMA